MGFAIALGCLVLAEIIARRENAPGRIRKFQVLR